MGKNQKYIGIDEWEIKCCCNNENCIESGLAFTTDEDDNGNTIVILQFFYLEKINENLIIQREKQMHLNKESILDIIKALKDLYGCL